ncbi:TPA: 10 kDa chaperonin [Trebouxia sp. C0004]
MAKRLIPLLDRVLIEKLTAPNKSVGGILLPESATSKVRAAEAGWRCWISAASSATMFALVRPFAQRLMPLLTIQYNEGKVLAVGQGRRTLTNGEIIPVAVKEGDKVLLPDYGGTQLKLDGKDYYLFRDEEVLGVLTS